MNETLTQADMVDLIRRGKRAKSLGDAVKPLPTVGYWTAVVVVALLRGTFSPIRSKDGTQR